MESAKYIDYKTIQNYLTDHYRRTGHTLTINAVHDRLLENKSFEEEMPVKRYPLLPFWSNMSDEEFEETLSTIPLRFQDPGRLSGNMRKISENALFSVQQFNRELLIYHHYNFLNDAMHSHTFFELYYVFRGAAEVIFPQTKVSLHPGDILFIAPDSDHSVVSDREDNFLLCVSIRKSNFSSLFANVLEQDGAVSAFFRKTLFTNTPNNYLLFITREEPDIKLLLKNMTLESCIKDNYSAISASNWTTLLFTFLLRNCYSTMQTYPPLIENNFSYILQYIISNYMTVTLDEVCSVFNYTKPYLCNKIKENTGQTFSQLVNEQKLNHAAMMLTSTGRGIEDVALACGFESADYFARTFKKKYGLTPSHYRKQQG